jgi:hypothetical protein
MKTRKRSKTRNIDDTPAVNSSCSEFVVSTFSNKNVLTNVNNKHDVEKTLQLPQEYDFDSKHITSDMFANCLSLDSTAYQIASRYFFGPNSNSNNNSNIIDESEFQDFDDSHANDDGNLIDREENEDIYDFDRDMLSDVSAL